MDLKSGKVSRHRLSDRGCEFPCVNPDHVGKKYQYAYVSGSANEGTWYSPFYGLTKIDVQNKGNDKFWLPEEGHFGAEPIFVKATDAKKEDDGYVLMCVWNSKENKSYLAILDAENLEFICSVDLDHHLGYGLHGSFKYADSKKKIEEKVTA